MLKNFKFITYVILSIWADSLPTFATEVLSAQELQAFDRSVYNSLPLSREADIKLAQNGKLKPFIEEVSQLAIRYGIGDCLGFRLAHRHHDLKPQEVMVERFWHLKDQPALITTVEQEGSPDIFPASWLYTPLGLTVFEYSSDPLIKVVNIKLSEQSEILEQIREIATKYQLENILAPAILGRNSFVHFNKSQPLYELIQEDAYASILINKPYEDIIAETQLGNLVQTTWGLTNIHFPVICATYCHTSDDDWKWHQYTHADE